ncbi:MAG: TIR domain-containing protein [candidate division Zixibacteria bacterium]|nr:TIR domain-containing protein [candidate division Zixibacteria bacterium]
MKIFFSYRSEDSGHALKIIQRQRDLGHEVWGFGDKIHPGDSIIKEMQSALRDSEVFILYVSPLGLSKWCEKEFEVAFRRGVDETNYRVIPVLGPGASKDTLPEFMKTLSFMDLRDNDGSFEGIGDILKNDYHIPHRPHPKLDTLMAPYRGLLVFETEHARIFFGRNEEIAGLLERMRSNNFLAVIGNSGSGKSSLIRAGLIPALHDGKYSDGGPRIKPWRIGIMHPGNDPIRGLMSALQQLNQDQTQIELSKLKSSWRRHLKERTGLLDQVTNLTQPGDHVLIFVDQFEELFTSHIDEAIRNIFIDSLLHVAQSKCDRNIHIIVTLRPDGYGNCFNYERLRRIVSSNLYQLYRMKERNLREVIEEPLFLFGMKPEPGLTTTLQEAIGNDPSKLPLLEFTLLRMWEESRVRESEGKVLTHFDYDSIGRLKGALQKHADFIFITLEDQEKRLAREVFVALTDVNLQGGDWPKHVPMSELRKLSKRDQEIDELVMKLINGRLLKSTEVSQSATRSKFRGTVMVSMAHASMIKWWSQLHQWIDQDRKNIILQQELKKKEEKWRAKKRADYLLLRSNDLIRAEDLVSKKKEGGLQELNQYVEASRQDENKRRRLVRVLLAALNCGLLGLMGGLLSSTWEGNFGWEQLKNRELPGISGAFGAGAGGLLFGGGAVWLCQLFQNLKISRYKPRIAAAIGGLLGGLIFSSLPIIWAVANSFPSSIPVLSGCGALFGILLGFGLGPMENNRPFVVGTYPAVYSILGFCGFTLIVRALGFSWPVAIGEATIFAPGLLGAFIGVFLADSISVAKLDIEGDDNAVDTTSSE